MFATEAIGRKVESEFFAVDEFVVAAFAAAIDDADAEHCAGRRAPPTLVVRRPVSSTMKRANDLVTETFCLHGEHDIWFHKPLEIGSPMQATAWPIGVWPNRAGVAISIRCELRDGRGDLVATQYETTLAPGGRLDKAHGDRPPAHDASAPPPDSREIIYPFALDQTRRYAEASGDLSSYTFDDEAARAKGLPGAIAHGLLTMAFCARAIVENCCEGDSRRLRRLAVRFSGLLRVVEGQRVVTRLWPDSRNPSQFHFDASDRNGGGVIRNGLAIVQ